MGRLERKWQTLHLFRDIATTPDVFRVCSLLAVSVAAQWIHDEAVALDIFRGDGEATPRPCTYLHPSSSPKQQWRKA